MKKLIHLLLVLIIFYILLQLGIKIFSKGYEINYKVDDLKVTEKRIKNTKDEKNNYYFEINFAKKIFGFQSFIEFNDKRVIKKIYTYNDNKYKCVLPTLKNKLFTDMLCLDGDIYYFYQDIQGKDKELDDYISKLKIYNLGKEEVIDQLDNVVLYNLPNKVSLSVENYKGVYELTNKNLIYDNKLFNKDIYQKNISGYIDNNYLIADYDESFEFHDFYLLNLKNNKKTKITSKEAISMYSFTQGVVDHALYLIDTRSKKQYKVDINKKEVSMVGNEAKGALVYKNGSFETQNMASVINNNTKFELNEVEPGFGNKNYEIVILKGNKLSGYYYLFERNEEYYDVYRVNVQNTDLITYLFKTDDINSVIYDDYVFYKYKGNIYYVDEYNENKRIVKFSELEYNKTLKFNIYR